MPDPQPPPQQAPTSPGDLPGPTRPRPWRTEGLPKGQPAKQRPAWAGWAPWLVGYGLLFGLLTLQDRFAGPQAVPYTEFKAQVASQNVKEVFARGNTIQGALKQREARCPSQKDGHATSSSRPSGRRSRRTTCLSELGVERGDRAGDADRPGARLPDEPADVVGAAAAAVRVLLSGCSSASRRPWAAAGRAVRRRRDAQARRPRDRARQLRGRRGHRRGRGRDQRGRRLPEEPGQVPAPGRPRAQGRAAGRRPGHRQDPAGPGDRGRGQRALLQRERLGVHRDDRRRGGQPGARAVRRGPQGRPRDHLHRRDRHHRALPRGRALDRRPRRARADAEPDPDRDGRLLRPRGRRRAGRHQPARRARSRAAAARPVRPHDHGAPAGPQGPGRDPGRPHPPGAAGRRRGPGRHRRIHPGHDRRGPRQPGQRGGAARRPPRARTPSRNATWPTRWRRSSSAPPATS